MKCVIKELREILRDDSKIDSDFIIRSAMYLSDYSTKVKIKDLNTSSKSISIIEKNFDAISKAIILAAKLIRTWGFTQKSIVSFSAIMPVAYFVYKNYRGKSNESQIVSEDKKKLKKMFVLSQVNKLYNSSVDSRLAKIKTALKDKNFWKGLKEAYPKVFGIKGKDGEKWIDSFTYKDKNYCYLLLVLLNPGSRKDIDFHIDHLHPKSFFIDSKDGFSMSKKLSELKLPAKFDKQKWMELCNHLPNLGLLNGDANCQKNDTSLEEWMDENECDYGDNFIAKNWNLSIDDFENFYKKRRLKMIKRIKEVLKQG